jgi:hypothetical protein
MTTERRKFELEGVLALTRAGREEEDEVSTISVGDDGSGERRSFFQSSLPNVVDAATPVATGWANQIGSKISSSGFFVTGSDVREKLLSLEGQIGSLDRDMATGERRDIVKSAWAGWKATWFAKAAEIRAKNAVSLNLSAGKIMDALDADQLALSRWRETILAEGGALTSPEPPAKRRSDISLGTMLKWTAYAAALFGVGYALKGVADATSSGTGLLQWMKPKAPALPTAAGASVAGVGALHGDYPVSVRLPSGDVLNASSLREAASAIESMNRPLLGRGLGLSGVAGAAYGGAQEE